MTSEQAEQLLAILNSINECLRILVSLADRESVLAALDEEG